MANELNPPKAEAPGPTDADRAARAEGAAAALSAELARAREALSSARPPPTGPVAPPPPDPFAKLTAEILTADPSDSFNRLDAGVRARVREEAGPAFGRLRQEMLGEINAIRTQAKFDTIFATNPDIEKDREGLAGAMAKAAHRANVAGVTASFDDLLNEGMRIYRAEKPAPVPALETGGAAGQPRQAPTTPGVSLYEKFYGKAEDDEIHDEDWDPKKETEAYADAHNGFLDEHNVNTQVATMAKENADRNSRKRAKAAAGG